MKLSTKDEDWLLEVAHLAAPAEVCGLVLAGGIVVQVTNVAELGEFELCPYELAEMQVGIDDIAAVWHSHPGGRRTPSREDLKYHLTGKEMIIVTLTEVIYCGTPS